MELKNQVVNLELSKRLKELNCKQESLWWWILCGDKEYHLRNNKLELLPRKYFEKAERSSSYKRFCSIS